MTIFRTKPGVAFFSILFVSLAVVIAAPWVGAQSLGLRDIFAEPDSPGAAIFWKLRVPRVLTGYLCGAALAVAGAVFQAIFRNSLAEPFTLGVSAGASAGMALALYLGGGLALGGFVPLETVFAFFGALLAIQIVYVFSRGSGSATPAAILLAGVAVNFFFSSFILLLQHFAAPHDAARMFRATIGGMTGAGQRQLLTTLPFVAMGLAAAARYWRELDIMSCGEDTALIRGVDTGRVRRRLYFAASLMIGGITALCGPVGFVGLAAPHVCRLILGPGHARLLPASAFLGGAFLVLADTLARTLAAPAEIPVGVISSLCGAPFFFWLLLRDKHNR